MMMREPHDFYALFEQHADAFAKAQTYAEFCTLANVEYLNTYRWAPAVFETAKAGKRTYRALKFPKVNSFAELFAEAKLLPTSNKRGDIPQGFKYLGGDASVCGSFGGTRGWSKDHKDIRSHYGAAFHGTYVLPRKEVYDMPMTLDAHAASYEAIPREDGILIIARDSHCIGSDWLALLPLTENIESLFDDATREFLANERQAARDAWGDE
jgi:hypothetical protein